MKSQLNRQFDDNSFEDAPALHDARYHRQPNDSVTVHHHVLRTLVEAATMSIDGVVRLGQASGTFDRWLGLDPSENGVHIQVEDDALTIDLSLVVKARANMIETSMLVQQEVSRTMKEYVGMDVHAVNVTIQDVVFADGAA